MLERLVASEPKRGRPDSVGLVVAATATALLFASIAWASTHSTEAVAVPQAREVRYVEIATVEEAAPAPPAEVPEVEVELPEAPDVSEDPALEAELEETPAGFQELQVPRELAGIPEPDTALKPVRAADYKGRGVAGGRAGGRQDPEEPTDTTRMAPAAPRVYELSVVSVPPALTNRDELPALLEELMPPSLRLEGEAGRVLVTFIIDVDGTVDPESIEFVDVSHRVLVPATRKALEHFRWEPGRVNDRPVRVIVMVPIEWEVH